MKRALIIGIGLLLTGLHAFGDEDEKNADLGAKQKVACRYETTTQGLKPDKTPQPTATSTATPTKTSNSGG